MSELIVWRLCAATRARDAFAGEGSYRRGGRWNPRGIRVVYCAESRSLAAMEVLVGVDEKEQLLEIPWVCMPATLPLESVEKAAKVPPEWRQYPHNAASQSFGAEWVQTQRSAALRVPSSVIAGEFNYLLNPAHPQFAKVRIGKPEPFSFDPRIAGPAQRR
jgi:RES domain-containing protein